MENKYTKFLWNLAEAYRGILMPEALTPAVIRLVFIKYATDNYLFAESRDEMIHYADMQKCISCREVRGVLASVMPILQMIDQKINANGILVDSYSSYSNDLIGTFYKKKTFNAKASEDILAILSYSDFSEPEAHNYVLEALKDFIYSSIIRSGKYGAEHLTNISVNKLVSRLLDVNDRDIYMDFACGYGLSSLEIAGNKPKQLLLSDINNECVQISAMLYIIQGESVRKTRFACRNVFDESFPESQITKAFIDFPLGYRIEKNRYSYSDGTILAVHKLIDSLQTGGKAIITCSAGLLFRTNKETTEFRKFLVNNGYMEAVITLPPVIPGSTVNVVLLVLSKQQNTEILLMDTSSNNVYQFSNNARAYNTELVDSGIDKIVEVYAKKEEILGVSKVVKAAEIIEANSLVPLAFIRTPKMELQMSSKEISSKLNDLYKKLYELRNNS